MQMASEMVRIFLLKRWNSANDLFTIFTVLMRQIFRLAFFHLLVKHSLKHSLKEADHFLCMGFHMGMFRSICQSNGENLVHFLVDSDSASTNGVDIVTETVLVFLCARQTDSNNCRLMS